MCDWASKVGLDGIIRMEPSFEVILCNIDADLDLVSKMNLVYPESIFSLGSPAPGVPPPNDTALGLRDAMRPRQKQQQPYFPPPTTPVYPPPPGWKGKQRNHTDVAYESIRAGMWHNHVPGESRILLDYTGIVSAYDEAYTSLVKSRQQAPRAKHRLGDISAGDWKRLKAEVHEVLDRKRSSSRVNWRPMFQIVIDRYAERLEELRYILRRTDMDSVKIAAAARHKVLIMLAPYMVLPRVKTSSPIQGSSQQSVIGGSNSQSEPDDDWLDRIHSACARFATAGIFYKSNLTVQEQRLAASLDRVQGAICSSLTHIWATAFDSEEKPVFARKMVAAWKSEVEDLMEWLDWPMWVRCDPPCGPGTQCVLATWPWEVRTGDEDIGPTCRDKVVSF
ncbi:hypothetical protein FRC07_000996 [Ceratobasidium sp. 392]|nr:hypothetical protein FRC07_000996 [Ceratobasidium sp. 392]